MKAKLVKYPYSEKKYRWDYKEMGKTFEYSWLKSDNASFETIAPYIPVEDIDTTGMTTATVIDTGVELGEQVNITVDDTNKLLSTYAMKYVPEDNQVFNASQYAKIALTTRRKAYDVHGTNFPIGNTLYYTLVYTVDNDVIKPIVKWYFNKQDALNEGFANADIATFDTRINYSTLMLKNGINFNAASSTFKWWDGPYDEPQPNIFVNPTTHITYSGIEWKTSDNKYYYAKLDAMDITNP